MVSLLNNNFVVFRNIYYLARPQSWYYSSVYTYSICFFKCMRVRHILSIMLTLLFLFLLFFNKSIFRGRKISVYAQKSFNRDIYIQVTWCHAYNNDRGIIKAIPRLTSFFKRTQIDQSQHFLNI